MAEGSSSRQYVETTVLVTGASGYLGTHLVHRLNHQGYNARCLVRSQSDPSDREFLTSMGADVRVGDLLDHGAAGEDVAKSFVGVNCAVHLIGSIAPKKGESLDEMHVEQTRRFVGLCRQYDVARVIMVTALG